MQAKQARSFRCYWCRCDVWLWSHQEAVNSSDFAGQAAATAQPELSTCHSCLQPTVGEAKKRDITGADDKPAAKKAGARKAAAQEKGACCAVRAVMECRCAGHGMRCSSGRRAVDATGGPAAFRQLARVAVCCIVCSARRLAMCGASCRHELPLIAAGRVLCRMLRAPKPSNALTLQLPLLHCPAYRGD